MTNKKVHNFNRQNHDRGWSNTQVVPPHRCSAGPFLVNPMGAFSLLLWTQPWPGLEKPLVLTSFELLNIKTGSFNS